MDSFFFLFSLVSFLAVLIPIIGFFFIIRRVIKKAKSNQPLHVLEHEKKEIIAKAREKKPKLLDWNKEHLESLSNDLDFSFSQGLTNKFNGYIKSMQGDKLIAFRRLDRGAMNATSRISAIAKNFEIYFSQEQQEVSIYFDSKYFGKIASGSIIGSDQRTIGKLNRNPGDEPFYLIELNGEKAAYIVKNTERRSFLRNPHHQIRYSSELE